MYRRIESEREREGKLFHVGGFSGDGGGTTGIKYTRWFVVRGLSPLIAFILLYIGARERERARSLARSLTREHPRSRAPATLFDVIRPAWLTFELAFMTISACFP